MTFSASSTTRTATDAVQEAPFDPEARQVDGAGRSYVDFHAALNGEVDEGDPVNYHLKRFLDQGRSEAFCCEYRKGYEGANRAITQVQRGETSPDRLREIEASRGRLAHEAGLNRAKDTLPPAPQPQWRFRTGARAGNPNDFGIVDARIVST